MRMPSILAGLISRPDTSRQEDWTRAIGQGDVPPFVHERLQGSASGRLPWLSTMTPAELLTTRSHGIRPLATVNGTCWLYYGASWTDGLVQGWGTALARLKAEAVAAGANAVIDVKMASIRLREQSSMDFTLVGTAVSVEGLKPSADPVVATVSVLEFVRLIEVGIVPVGLAVGARYAHLVAQPLGRGLLGGFYNVEWDQMSAFWQRLRKDAYSDIRTAAARLGNGVLAHTEMAHLARLGNDNGGYYLGRQVVLGTVVEVEPGQHAPIEVVQVVDLADEGALGAPPARDPAIDFMRDNEETT